MTSQNFPGNPYALADGAKTEAQQAIYQAIMALAFEVRTANLLAAAQPVITESKAASEDARERLAEAAPRLGLASARTTTS